VEWSYEPSYEPPRTNRTATYEGSRTKDLRISYEGTYESLVQRNLRKSRTKELTRVSYEGPRTSSLLCKPQVTQTQGRRLGEEPSKYLVESTGRISTNQLTGKELFCQLKAVRHESAWRG